MRPSSPPPWIVVVAVSSGGIQALFPLVSRLPADLPATVLIASHTPANSKCRLPTLLSAAGPLPAFYADDGQVLEAGRIFVAPPDKHLVVQRRRLRLSSGEKEHLMRPAADVLFRSAARTFGSRSIGIVLSGGGRDGAAGLAEIQAAGGYTLVQEPHDAKLATMPLNALAGVKPDACVPAAELAALVARFVGEPDQTPRDTARSKTPRKRPRPRSSSLKDLRIFVVEDEYLLASEVVGMLRELECHAVGPVPDVTAGLRVLAREAGRLDGAVLDVDLRGKTVLPLALVLTQWEVPFVFATGYDETVLPEAWADAPRLQKPYGTQALGAALRQALRLRWFPSSGAPASVYGIARRTEALKDSRNLVMRSRALRTAFSRSVLMQSYEAIRQTHARITDSTLRTESARRTLGGHPRPKSDKAGDE